MTAKYLEHGEGFSDITLTRPLKIAGVDVAKVRMREPTVGDQLTMQAMKASDAEQELWILATLTELSPDDLKRLPLRDYDRLRKCFFILAGTEV